MSINKKYTVITGASMGLGRELALESARRGRNLILVALPGRDLTDLCQEIELHYGVRAVARECDLTDETGLYHLAQEIIEQFSVDQLINNAGVGGTARFDEVSGDYLERMIHLNVRATTLLTHLLLPKLRSHPRALIMNIASVAAFGALPYKTIYPATKSYIYSFSRGLDRELRHTGVRVVVVAPGPMLTNPEAVLRITRLGGLGRIGLLSASMISKLALDGAERGRKVIVPGFMNQLNCFLLRYVPENWRLALMDKVLEKGLNVAGSEPVPVTN